MAHFTQKTRSKADIINTSVATNTPKQLWREIYDCAICL